MFQGTIIIQNVGSYRPSEFPELSDTYRMLAYDWVELSASGRIVV